MPKTGTTALMGEFRARNVFAFFIVVFARLWYHRSMIQEPPNLVLELLKHIRASTDRMENDISDIKFRLGQVEQTLTHHTRRFDRMDERLLTMEKRLGLVDA